MTSSGTGSVHVICGPMYAGKSSTLITLVERERLGQEAMHGEVQVNSLLLLTPRVDTRYDKNGRSIASHAGGRLDAFPLPIDADLTETVLHMYGTEYEQSKVIAIDEAQLFVGLLAFCERATRDGKRLLVAGLDLTSDRRAFGEMVACASLAEKLTKLTAICAFCGQEAIYTLRSAMASKETVLIGGKNLYRAVCRRCHASASF
jgi:thymidine kinase